jgi:Flp pilus assembly protein CpaB
MATTTRPGNGALATDAGGLPPRRVITRPPGLPGGRAVVGGLLIALAGVGTFVSWQQTTSPPRESYAVATRTLDPGDPITADAVEFVPVDLPGAVAGGAFTSPAQLEGRVTLAPVREGELFQLGALSDQAEAAPSAEVSVALERDLAVDGRLAPGDTVDVYATYDEGTEVVASGVRVIAVNESGGSFDDGSELTVTLALTDTSQRIPVINAARDGQVTLVRTTHVVRDGGDIGSSSAGAPPSSPPQAPAGGSTTSTIRAGG